MQKKILSIFLIGLLINIWGIQSIAAQTQDKEAQSAEKVKTKIARLGVGEKARVSLTLKDNTQLKGYISENKENEFVVADAKTNAKTVVPYSQVKTLKGRNGSNGTKIAIGVGVAAGVAAALIIVIYLVAVNQTGY